MSKRLDGLYLKTLKNAFFTALRQTGKSTQEIGSMWAAFQKQVLKECVVVDVSPLERTDIQAAQVLPRV